MRVDTHARDGANEKNADGAEQEWVEMVLKCDSSKGV